MPTTSPTANRLLHEKSPYLQQHAYNPVAWYPWGEEALAKAKQENRPIFLSIGYSTCHWCHVMEHESFENPEIAQLLNQWFVSIKVDREEHPDLDHVYMSAVTAMTGRGGWPLTVFLTPDREPFYGGTYFPPERRHNLPGMKELLPAVADAWAHRREEIVASAAQLTSTLQEQLVNRAPAGVISLDTLHKGFNQAASAFDPGSGGFGGAPKFPRSHELSFLLVYWARTQSGQALDMVTTTLDHLTRGGIHDHLGGGFHRYATDARWLVPHFEKMLYDQALLARTYLEAYRVTRHPGYAETARGIFEYVLRDLTDSAGGFYSAEDADSEGEEGKFYVWTPEETIAVLGEAEADLFNRVYGVTPEGNIEGGRSILNLAQPLQDFAKLKGFDEPTLRARLAEARGALLAARSQRVRPHRDEKILTSWNGLMIASLAYGAATLDEPRYLDAAKRAAEFLLANVRGKEGLQRRYRDGEARYAGTLEDYAFLSYGLLELYEASYEPRYLAEAKILAEAMRDRFWDAQGSGFFFRSNTQEPLIARAKDIYDSATPSGNSIAALVLLRLGRLTGGADLEAAGRETLEGFAHTVDERPFSYPQFFIAWDFALGPTQEIVIAGDPKAVQTRQLLKVLRELFLPRAVTALHPPGPDGTAIEALAPYITTQGPLRGEPAAYVCENFVCQFPTTSTATFRKLLAPTTQQAQH